MKKEISLPLDILVPAALFGSSFLCYFDYTLFPTILFSLLGFGFLLRNTLVDSFLGYVINYVSFNLKKLDNLEKKTILLQIKERLIEFEKETDLSQSVFAPMEKTLKSAIIKSLQDDQTQYEILATTTSAIIKASEDEALKKAIMQHIKMAVVEGIQDQHFIEGIVKSILAASETILKNEEIKKGILNIITEAVTTALQDERIVTVFRKIMKDTLQDGALYRATAKGLLGAITPRLTSSSGNS
mmetsp:Transcript_4353/g.5023  ORF Transcript_4353/g.5023 Transcript_4353/m.5023 type:complete len:243 (-) Transcript_4353:88-816(-)